MDDLIDDVLDDLRELRAGYLDMEARKLADERRAAEDEHRAAAEKFRSAEDRRHAELMREIVERSIARMEALKGGGADSMSSVADAAVVDPSSEQRSGRRRHQRRWSRDVELWLPRYFDPDLDDVTGEPVYPQCLVVGKKTNRQRALSVARVCGPELRENSLARVIYESGETKASSPASVRSSLGGLVRYGGDWERENGTLYYVGEGLNRNVDLIRQLTNERLAKQQQAN